MIKEIKFTDNAIKQINHLLSTKDKGYFFRIAIKGGGCSGLTYILDITDDGPGDNDQIIEENGIRLFVDKKSYIFLAGTVLEYSGGLNGKGFVFNNPNAKTTCGCGTSFSV